MKFKKLFVAVATLGLLGTGFVALAACGGGGNSQNQSATYAVTYEESADYEIEGLKARYKAEEEVKFTVNVLNETKELSAVRFDGTKLKAEDDGSYKAIMPDYDAIIKINLSDIKGPEFAVSYVGKNEVGQTITISTKIDGKDNKTFDIEATKGGNLITIDTHQVTLNAEGDVSLKVTAKSGNFNLEETLSFKIVPNEEAYGTNITYDEHVAMFNGETQLKNNIGKWLYWAGDGGVIDSLTYTNGTYTLTYSTGWAWYGVQLFFGLPYGAAGEQYHVRWEVNSNAAGQITISGNVIDLAEGDNIIDLDIPLANSRAILSVQFGVNGGDQFSGNQFTFKPVRVYDLDQSHQYHLVKFSTDSALLKEIYVRAGEPVEAPTAPEVSGKVLEGFYDGNTKYDSALAISKAYNFVAKYVEKSADTVKKVSLMLGNNKLKEVEVAKGGKLVLPEDLDLGFGKKVMGVYSNSALSTAFDLETAINEDLTLYLKTGYMCDYTYFADGGTGYKVPAEWITNNEDGSFTINFVNGGFGGNVWDTQINFYPIIGKSGEHYRVSFEYSINTSGGHVQIYDSATIDSADLEEGSHVTGQLIYDGAQLSNKAYISFELGGIANSVIYSFTIHSITCEVF